MNRHNLYKWVNFRSATTVAKGDDRRTGVLSHGEVLYVALAANSINLLQEQGYTIAEALSRIGPEWTADLVARWEKRGHPKNFR